jgi:hypothetical protein
MGKENVQKFYELLMNDKAVADELQNIAAGKDIAGQEEAATLIVEFAAGKGFDFTAGELAEFEQENQRELTPEELEKINASGGGYCLGLGFGWSEGYGIGWTKCSVIGKGLGVTWSENNDLENEEGNRLAKNIVETVAHAGSKIIGK